MNKPNSKPSQIFTFKGDEARHAIGVKHAKRKEFESLPGISSIELLNAFGTRITKKGQSCHAFRIKGLGYSVDVVMKQLQLWLEKCSTMKQKEQQRFKNILAYNFVDSDEERDEQNQFYYPHDNEEHQEELFNPYKFEQQQYEEEDESDHYHEEQEYYDEQIYQNPYGFDHDQDDYY